MFSSTDLFSPRELFERVAPAAPSHLVPQETIQRLLDLGDLLPPLHLWGFGFECFLGEKKPKADFALCLNLRRVNQNLRDWFDLKTLPICLQENAGWEQLSAFMENGEKIDLFKNRDLFSLWLEFDIGSKNDWPPSPNAFWGFNLDARLNSIHSSLSLLTNEPLRSRVQSIIAIATSFRLKVRQIGWMFGRAPDWVKLVLHKITLKDLEPFLKAISYSCPIDPLIKTVQSLSGGVSEMMLHLDVGEKGVGPKIGIECLTGKEGAPFFETFLSENLITKEDHQAILSWEGIRRYTHDEQRHDMKRYLFHFKVVYHPDKPLQTKAYLAAFWLK